MTKLAIIHYMPLEYYPPVTNFLDTLAGIHPKRFESIQVFSCQNVMARANYQSPSIENSIKYIAIKRYPFPRGKDNVIIRLYKYIHFNLFTLLGLLLQRPTSILYYESYSAWPVYIYSRFFNRRCRIFIHNHEYAEKQWYATTMLVVRHFHQLEKKWLYPCAVWNSQTNRDRLKFFQKDHSTLREESLRVLPNYPPISWKSKLNIYNPSLEGETKTSTTLRVVYVGSLSFQSTYIKEFCGWVMEQNGEVQLDIYAYNLYQDVMEYLSNLGSPNINFYEKGVEYNEMPLLLSQYQVGLILYKAHNENYTFNAPNKLFEYLACNLDVWYHKELQGPQAYNTVKTYPQVIPIDFENLLQFNWQTAIDKRKMTYKSSNNYCEQEYDKLIKELIKS